jgi:indole-3-glycerol phosphate synthase
VANIFNILTYKRSFRGSNIIIGCLKSSPSIPLLVLKDFINFNKAIYNISYI